MFATLDQLDGAITRAAAAMALSLRTGTKVMFCGNGGSAADSQHLAAELTGRFVADRAPLAGLALTTDSSAISCIGNDYGFERIFARQVEALGQAGDCLLGISTSGNSANVIAAFAAARSRGIVTIGLLGRDGGAMLPLSDIAIIVESSVTARVQEAHILIGHSLIGMIEQALAV